MAHQSPLTLALYITSLLRPFSSLHADTYDTFVTHTFVTIEALKIACAPCEHGNSALLETSCMKQEFPCLHCKATLLSAGMPQHLHPCYGRCNTSSC